MLATLNLGTVYRSEQTLLSELEEYYLTSEEDKRLRLAWFTKLRRHEYLCERTEDFYIGDTVGG